MDDLPEKKDEGLELKAPVNVISLDEAEQDLQSFAAPSTENAPKKSWWAFRCKDTATQPKEALATADDERVATKKLARSTTAAGFAPEAPRLSLWERSKIGKEHYLNLMLVVPLVITYICLGALIFSFFEDTSYLNSLYWAVVTSGTVGYGDIAPTKPASKIFFVFYILISLTLLVAALSFISTTLSELSILFKKKGEVHIPTVWSVMKSLATTLVTILVLMGIGVVGLVYTMDDIDKGEGDRMYTNKRKIPTNIRFDGYYLTITTLTTVGYGDLSADTTESKIFLIFYILIGVTIFTARMGELLGLFNEMSDARKFKKMLKRGITKEVIEIFDITMSGDVDINEFVIGFLVGLGKVDTDDITKIRELFHKLDEDGNGRLDMRDVDQANERFARRMSEKEMRRNSHRGPASRLPSMRSRSNSVTRSATQPNPITASEPGWPGGYTLPFVPEADVTDSTSVAMPSDPSPGSGEH